MRTTGWLLVSASALCVGVWLVVSGWAQPRPSVSQAVRHLRRHRMRMDRDWSLACQHLDRRPHQLRLRIIQRVRRIRRRKRRQQ